LILSGTSAAYTLVHNRSSWKLLAKGNAWSAPLNQTPALVARRPPPEISRSSHIAATGRKAGAQPQPLIYSSPQRNKEPTMTTRTASKILGITLGVTLSMAWLSTVVVGMHSASAPAVRTIELPSVVIVGKKSAAVDATALTTTPAMVRKT
jgi:hypothetical protein